MIDQPFRALLPKFTGPLIHIYKKLGLSPNHLTVLGFLCALATAGLVVKGMFVEAFFMWWLGRLFDGTDGILARETGQSSDFGAHLDILLDMASYSIVIVALHDVFPELGLNWALILSMYALCITGALSLGALEEKRSISYDDNRGLRLTTGLAEAGETGIAYSVFFLFPAWIEISSWIWIGILLITVLARLYLARKILRS